MISAGFLTVAVLAGPVIDQAAAVQIPQTVSGPLHLANAEQLGAFRTIYRDLARKSFRTAKPDPFTITPRLVAFYSTLETVDGLPHSERLRMQETLRARLRQIREKLAKDRSITAARAGRLGTRNSVSALHRSNSPNTGLSGSEQQNVAELIALIEETIAPDSWTSRGGHGSIGYYSKLKVLVIRQTGEVHQQIGGLLKGVRRAQ
ncbi:MAG: hypothetical protein VB858_08940 [Planctomycetaceae bacterium]